MPTSSVYSLPYPAGSDNNDVPGDLAALANAVDGTLADLVALLTPTTAQVLTSEATASTSFTDLSTPGPTVTKDTGTNALCIVSFQGATSSSTFSLLATVQVSGASTVAAHDDNSASLSGSTTTGGTAAAVLLTGLTPGSNTFTLKYRNTSATSASYLRRRLTVIGLP